LHGQKRVDKLTNGRTVGPLAGTHDKKHLGKKQTDITPKKTSRIRRVFTVRAMPIKIQKQYSYEMCAKCA